MFNLFFSKGTYYFFEIILNGYKISFGENKEYKYKKTEEKIIFEGNWESENIDEDKEQGYLPKEIFLNNQ